MSNPSMETKGKELMELKRMKEELEAEIAVAEDESKTVIIDYLLHSFSYITAGCISAYIWQEESPVRV